MTPEITNVPKAPRWINTEAGHKAWCEYTLWRGKASKAFSVQDRTRLLDEAEQLTHPEVVIDDRQDTTDTTAEGEHPLPETHLSA